MSTLCWHCGEPLPATVVHARVRGELRAVCCHGCRAAAEWIEQLDSPTTIRARSQRRSRTLLDAADRSGCLAWQRDELARHVVRDLGEGRRETMLFVEDVRCTACVWLIERASLPAWQACR